MRARTATLRQNPSESGGSVAAKNPSPRCKAAQGLAAASVLALILVFASVAAWAQTPSPDQIEEWNKLTPDQKDTLRRRYQAFKRLTPEQQQEILENREQLRKMAPAERRIVLENYSAFQQLTPEEQRFLHQEFQRWKRLPPERRQQLRNNYRRFLQMTPEQRSRFLENYRVWRKMTPEERARLRRSSGPSDPAIRKKSFEEGGPDTPPSKRKQERP
jgi:Protein of unknown function (DUF3106)